MKRFRRILVATDFSPASAPAVAQALALARADGAELLVAHIYRPPPLVHADSVGPGVYEEWDGNLRAAVRARLEPIVAAARRQLVNARALALPAVPRPPIACAARRHGVDLVVTVRPRCGLLDILMMRRVERPIPEAPCPVLVVERHGGKKHVSGPPRVVLPFQRPRRGSLFTPSTRRPSRPAANHL